MDVGNNYSSHHPSIPVHLWLDYILHVQQMSRYADPPSTEIQDAMELYGDALCWKAISKPRGKVNDKKTDSLKRVHDTLDDPCDVTPKKPKIEGVDDQMDS